MLYVSEIDKANNLVCVTDSDDGIVDKVTPRELRKIANLGVAICGVTYVNGKLRVKVVKQVMDISTLVAKLTTFGNYEELSCYRFNSEYNICWVFKNHFSIYDVGDDNDEGDIDAQETFIEKLNSTPGVLFYLLPNVTKLEFLFPECQVKSLDLSHFDTRNVTDMRQMFDGCKAEVLNLSSFDTRNVTNMSSMFANCEIANLNLFSFDTRNVTDMAGMFYICKAKSINLSSFDTRNVADMSAMFRECEVESLDLSHLDTSNVTDMRDMFYGCEAERLDLSSFDTSKVTDMTWMFRGCQAESIDLSSFDISSVTDMYEMFMSCQAARIRAKDPRIIEQLKKDDFKGEIIRV